MFEYMASGLPVIASNFPLWNQIVSDAGCGICVDQTKPEIIKEKILSIISDNEFLINAGKNGRKAIEEKYNWEIETKKLVYFYSSL
jgi:glycosyltransferase involved in cell wall biosynthesis